MAIPSPFRRTVRHPPVGEFAGEDAARHHREGLAVGECKIHNWLCNNGETTDGGGSASPRHSPGGASLAKNIQTSGGAGLRTGRLVRVHPDHHAAAQQQGRLGGVERGPPPPRTTARARQVQWHRTRPRGGGVLLFDAPHPQRVCRGPVSHNGFFGRVCHGDHGCPGANAAGGALRVVRRWPPVVRCCGVVANQEGGREGGRHVADAACGKRALAGSWSTGRRQEGKRPFPGHSRTWRWENRWGVFLSLAVV